MLANNMKLVNFADPNGRNVILMLCLSRCIDKIRECRFIPVAIRCCIKKGRLILEELPLLTNIHNLKKMQIEMRRYTEPK